MALPASRSSVILVVESEPATLMNTVDPLMEQGYRVIAQANADWALATLSTRSDVDLLLTSIHVSGTLGGLALARLVERRWPAIAIIVTSDHGRPAPSELPVSARFLPAPSASSTLLAAVREDPAARCRCGPGRADPHEIAARKLSV